MQSNLRSGIVEAAATGVPKLLEFGVILHGLPRNCGFVVLNGAFNKIAATSNLYLRTLYI